MPVNDTLSAALDAARRQADRLVTPDTRQKTYASIEAFARAQPLLFSFITTQLFFALLPLFLFTVFALATTVLATLTALAFILFWLGLAALVLGCALCFSSALAVGAWAWLVGSFVILRWAWAVVNGSGRDNGWDEGKGNGTGNAREKAGGKTGSVMVEF